MNQGEIHTLDAHSNGVLVQSIGGGGGNGGGVLAPVKTPVIGNSLINLHMTVQHGGQGGPGGSGGPVQAGNDVTGIIATAGVGGADRRAKHRRGWRQRRHSPDA
ncbi:hypothetical protein BUW96_15685 [Achromobacter insolitus]|nr:hypothetical protein BUW96_15685 [Achromobacter insolitus]